MAWLGYGPLSAQEAAPSPDYQRLFSMALMRLNEGRPTAAQWLLRRAFRHAKTDAERAAVRNAFQTIADSKPLKLTFGFNVAPSNNINGGSTQDFFTLEGLPFIFPIPAEARALSGTEISGDVDLSYRLAKAPRYTTSLNLYLYGRTFNLSSEAEAAAPLVSGSDFAYVSSDLALRHEWMMLDQLGPTSVSVELGRVNYGGEPLYRFHGLSANQDFRLRQGLLSVGASYEHQATLRTWRNDAVVVEARAALGFKTKRAGHWRVTLTTRKTQSLETTENPLESTENFQETQAGASLTPNWRVLGAVPTLSLGLGAKDYDEFTLSLDGRRDRSASLGLSLRLDSISIMGFSPVLNVTGTRTRSNVVRYDTEVVRATFGVQSQF